MTCATTSYGMTSEKLNATVHLPRTEGLRGHSEPQASALSVALDLQSKVFVSLIVAAALLFFITLVLLLVRIHLKKKNRDSRRSSDSSRNFGFLARSRLIICSSICLSTAISFAAAVSTTLTANALEYTSCVVGDSSNHIVFKAGKTVQALQWPAFGFSTLFLVALEFWERRRRGGDGDDDEDDDDRSMITSLTTKSSLPSRPPPVNMPPRPSEPSPWPPMS